MNSHQHINPVSKSENSTATKPLFFQPKLTVNQPDDVYEQEADAMADRVMHKDILSDSSVFLKPAPAHVVQPKCSACEAKEKPHLEEDEAKEETAPELKQPIADLPIQRKCAHCEEEEQNKISRKESGDNSPVVTANVEQTIQSPGQKMDDGTRSFMEGRFGYNFGDVQIHNDSRAHQSSKDINALAYTHQNHIAFGAGQYQPETDTGKRLLAHELTHVVQQSGGVDRKLIQRDPVVTDGEPTIIDIYNTKGNIKEDVKFLKQVADNFSRALIVQGNVLMVYKIDGATPIQLKSFIIKSDIVLMSTYFYWGNDERFYPIAYDSGQKKYVFMGKDVPVNEDQKKTMAKVDQMFTVPNWFRTESDKDSFYKLFNNDRVAGLIVMPYSGGAESKGAKGDSDQEEIPPKPKWADAFEKSMADVITTTHNAEPTSEDIPASFYFYYSKSKSKWRGYAAQKDAADKAINKVYTDVNESDKPADLLTNIRQLIRIEKLKTVTDVKPSKDATPLAASMLWAYELKLKIEKLMADERKAHTNLYDLPDKISLTTNEGDEANVYLRIDLFVNSVGTGGAAETQMKSGVLPDALQKEMMAEDILKVIKAATKALQGGSIKAEGRETKSFDHVKKAYPSNIIAKDVRPDGKTVTGAHHAFKMNVQLEKMEGTDTLNLMTLHMRTVYYYWDIYKVNDQLSAEERAELSSDWKDRRDSLSTYFKESGQLKTKPLIDTEKLEQYNLQMDALEVPQAKVDAKADMTRQQIEDLKSAGVFYGSRLSYFPEADFTFPKEEGDYIVYCRAQVEPSEDTIIRPSEAFFPIMVEDGHKLGKESVNKPFNEIEDTTQQLAKVTTDEEKTRLQNKLTELNRRQTMSLPDRVTEDITSTDDTIRLAKKLKDLYIKSKSETSPFSLTIAKDKADGKKMLDIWLMVSMNEPSKAFEVKIDELVANLSSQAKGLNDVQKNLQSFSGDYDHTKPTYTPVVTLISQETGQEYQLITMVAETKDSTDAETKIVLIDVTTHKTQAKYNGSSKNPNKTEALKEAIQDAFVDFGKDVQYGKGSVEYRVPIINASGSVNSKPGIKQTILGILEAVAAVAGIAALVIGTVATGGMLVVALGVGSAVIGAGVAGYHIYDRSTNHKLEPDVDLAMDILNILGPLLIAVNASAKAAKMASLGLKTVEGLEAANTFLKLEKGMAVVQKAELVTNFFAINYKTVKDLHEISEANLPPEQKDALEKQIILNAVLANVMIAVAVRNELKAKTAPSEEALNEMISSAANEQKYRKALQRDGLIDAEGRWTIPELNEAAAKTKVEAVDPNAPKPKEEPNEQANTVPKEKPAAPAKEETEKHVPDDYEQNRKVKMKGHGESPDGQHEVEVYKDGTVGRCSPVAAGAACPLLQVQFKQVLDERPSLKKGLQDLMTEIGKFGNNVPKPKMDELAAFEQHLRVLETVSKTSSAPKSYKVKEVNYSDDVDLPGINDKIVLELPNGERAWRNPDGSIDHEASISDSPGRQGFERQKYSGNKTGLSSMGNYERAHSFGQGFGWESPYALHYAPRFVNQTLQNNGIEQYIRSLRNLLPAGQELIINTNTEAIPLTNRLKSIEYDGFVLTADGKKTKAFNYKIEVTGTRDAPVIDADSIKFTTSSDPATQKILTDLQALIPPAKMPAPITAPTHHNGF